MKRKDMLENRVKKYYRNFSQLEDDILKIYPNATIIDDYFKVFVLHDNDVEKLVILHSTNKLEVVR